MQRFRLSVPTGSSPQPASISLSRGTTRLEFLRRMSTTAVSFGVSLSTAPFQISVLSFQVKSRNVKSTASGSAFLSGFVEFKGVSSLFNVNS